MTETIIPMKNGCNSVAHMMAVPTVLAAVPIAGAHPRESKTPTQIVTKGVTIISIFVSFETNLPNSAAKMDTTKTARGPPAPPSSLAAIPTAARENKTKGGHCKASPIEIAMAAPVAPFA